jgi:hypothetical protein
VEDLREIYFSLLLVKPQEDAVFLFTRFIANSAGGHVSAVFEPYFWPLKPANKSIYPAFQKLSSAAFRIII